MKYDQRTNSKQVSSTLQEQECQSKSSKFDDICIRTKSAIHLRKQRFQKTLNNDNYLSLSHSFSDVHENIDLLKNMLMLKENLTRRWMIMKIKD